MPQGFHGLRPWWRSCLPRPCTAVPGSTGKSRPASGTRIRDPAELYLPRMMQAQPGPTPSKTSMRRRNHNKASADPIGEARPAKWKYKYHRERDSHRSLQPECKIRQAAQLSTDNASPPSRAPSQAATTRRVLCNKLSVLTLTVAFVRSNSIDEQTKHADIL